MIKLMLIIISLCSVCLGDELKPDLATFNSKIKPLLDKYCVDCHGPKKVKGKMRFDDIDPNILKSYWKPLSNAARCLIFNYKCLPL